MAFRRTLLVALLLLCFATVAEAQVHLVRKADGRAVIFNIGSGWRVNGRVPTDQYLISQRDRSSAYDDLIRQHARAEGVDEKIVKAVMLIESNFNTWAVSPKGARGLMQLMPKTAARYGVRNAHDAHDNVRGGVRYLADLMDMFGGNTTLALAAYNAGENAVLKYGGIPPYAETQEYVRRAMVILGGKSSSPVLGGGFKGMTPVTPVPRFTRAVADSAPVKLRRTSRGPVIANEPVPKRTTPILGRVVPVDEKAGR